jgi:hypothetical protein
MIKESFTQFPKYERNYIFGWKTKGIILIFLIAFFMTGCRTGKMVLVGKDT